MAVDHHSWWAAIIITSIQCLCWCRHNKATVHLANVCIIVFVVIYAIVLAIIRSSASLSVLRHNLSFASRAFRISAPKIWNSLPPQSQTLDSFRRHLKIYYFQLVYPAPKHPSPMLPDSLLGLCHYINHLLTYLRVGCFCEKTLSSQ